MTHRIHATATHRLNMAPERVFDAWLDPAKVRIWLASALQVVGLPGDIRQVQIEPHVGGSFLFSDLRNGMEARHWGKYLELERPNRLVFTWIVDESDEADPSKVTIYIQPDGDDCIATIIHEMDAAWIEFVSKTEQSWTRMLTAIGVTQHW